MKLKKLLLVAAFLSTTLGSYAQDQNTAIVNVYFITAQYGLTQRTTDSLNQFIKDHKNDHNVTVIGHCDKRGGFAYNDQLSEDRANMVMNYLLKHGLSRQSVDTVKGFGKRRLIDAPGTEDEVNSKNRVVIVKCVYGSTAKAVAPVVKQEPAVAAVVIKKPMPVDTVYSTESIVMPLPYPAEILAINKHPHKGDILKVERSVEMRNDTPFVFKKLYVASETMEEPKQEPAVIGVPNAQNTTGVVVTPPSEIAEDIKPSDLTLQVSEQLKKSSVGQSLVIRGINFDFGYHIILKKDMPALQAVLSALKQIPTLKVEIQGHVCCWPIGQEGFDKQTKEYNLSYNRAKAVFDYLVANGIEANRLTYNGYGMKHPLVYPEKNKNDEYRNRRVEFKIVSK